MVTAFTSEPIQMEVIRLRTFLFKSACCDTGKRWFTPLFIGVFLPPNISSVIESQDERDWHGKKLIKLHWNGSENAHFVLRCLLIFLSSGATPYCIPSGHLCPSVTWCNHPERSIYIIVHQNAPTVVSPLLTPSYFLHCPSVKMCPCDTLDFLKEALLTHLLHRPEFMKKADMK